MKILIINLASLFTGTVALAQKAISEGTLSYDIAIKNTADKAPTAASNAALIVYIKGSVSRTDMTSNLGSEKTIYDAKAGTAVILKEYSGQKLMITLTRENWKEKNKKSEGVSFTDQVEKKEILNYSCTKAVGKLGDGSIVTVFYTKDLTVQNKEYDPLFKTLSGMPLQYEVETGKLKFTYTINKIDQNNLPQTKFDIPKVGYRVITYDDNKQAAKK